MKKEAKRILFLFLGLLILFIIWTVLVSLVDVSPIGPNDSEVGFAAVNGYFHRLTGVHWRLYDLTDILSAIPLVLVVFFAALGAIQLIKRKKLSKVDFDLFILCGFYIAVIACFIFFELFIINFRPVLIEGKLEASYPSSTTMLTLCVMTTAIMQTFSRVKNTKIRNILAITMSFFTAFMVIGRLISGVHWLSDIIGGILLSASLVMLYRFFCRLND